MMVLLFRCSRFLRISRLGRSGAGAGKANSSHTTQITQMTHGTPLLGTARLAGFPRGPTGYLCPEVSTKYNTASPLNGGVMD
jgi:hypothetical protein